MRKKNKIPTIPSHSSNLNQGHALDEPFNLWSKVTHALKVTKLSQAAK
jgi:hypothetical protein